MRLTWALFKNSRAPQNVNKVPLKPMTPLVLKNYVHKRDRSTIDHGCLYEMSLLLSCLEENENENKNCIPQINSLYACNDRYQQNMQKQKMQRGTKAPVPNSKHHSPAQITYLLQKYPTV